MIRLELLIKKKRGRKKKTILRAALTLLLVVMSEGKVIILLNSCGVGERRQTFKAAWRLVFVISFLLFLIPVPEIYGSISASNFSFFFKRGIISVHLTGRQSISLLLLLLLFSVHVPLTRPVFSISVSLFSFHFCLFFPLLPAPQWTQMVSPIEIDYTSTF